MLRAALDCSRKEWPKSLDRDIPDLLVLKQTYIEEHRDVLLT
jgi:hypothetical protein